MGFSSEIVIGLEIHAELKTKTKMFCSCSTTGTNEPNSRTCPTCLGHPGSKPVLNKRALEYAIKLCMALECKIASELVLSRKSYFYPDMAKNYQISQYEMPLGTQGLLRLSSGKAVEITRIHIEEDPASLVHPQGMTGSSYVLVDYNRSGNPLVEIVTEPVMQSPNEARDFLKQLITVLGYLEIFDINEGIIKADANISIKDSGYTRVEIKNVTGFKEIERALNYEVERQKKEVSNIVQETRAWDADLGVTRSLRLKETEDDYGYIVDPDLAIIDLSSEMLSEIQKTLPELAQDKVRRYVEEFKLDKTDAEVLSSELKLAQLFERLTTTIDPILAARWLRRELLRVINYNKMSFQDLEVDEGYIKELLEMIQDKEITENVAQKIIEQLIEKPFSPRAYVNEHSLGSVNDDSVIKEYCETVIREHPEACQDYLSGNEKSLHYLVGQVMRLSSGKAVPDKVNQLFKELLR